MSIYPECFEECAFRFDGTLIKYRARGPPSFLCQRSLTSEGPKHCSILLEMRLRHHAGTSEHPRGSILAALLKPDWHSAASCSKTDLRKQPSSIILKES